jgi:hypothetical protein
VLDAVILAWLGASQDNCSEILAASGLGISFVRSSEEKLEYQWV